MIININETKVHLYKDVLLQVLVSQYECARSQVLNHQICVFSSVVYETEITSLLPNKAIKRKHIGLCKSDFKRRYMNQLTYNIKFTHVCVCVYVNLYIHAKFYISVYIHNIHILHTHTYNTHSSIKKICLCTYIYTYSKKICECMYKHTECVYIVHQIYIYIYIFKDTFFMSMCIYIIYSLSIYICI